ncbi:WD repeat-containing protein 1-B-like [Glandiceps talaboti]
MSHSRKAVFATLPHTERGKPIVLGADPKGKNFLYTNGQSVIIRDVENPAIADVYTQHAKQCTVAKYAPSGFYIASGDVTGKIRIWDTTQADHLLKYEYQPLSGAVKDIAWSPDSKRIVVVGEGKEKFGAAIMFDTGTSVGEIIGHSKSINAVDFKQTRPFRVVTASEDNDTAFSEGPPFKFKFSCKEHSRFVNCIRYAPNGEKYLTGGADCKSFIYDGKTGELIGELGGNGGQSAHAGGIYGVSWSPDSTEVLTVSADKTAKIWNVEKNELVTEFKMGTDLMDQQVGCLWMGDYLLSVSLSGNINYLDRNNPTTPLRIIKGHNKPITSLEVTEDKSTIYSGSSNGQIKYWSPSTGVAEDVGGDQHTNQVSCISAGSDDLVTVSMDDTTRTIDHSSHTLGNTIGLDSQPKGVAHGKDGLVVVACINEVVVFRNGQKVYTQKEKYAPSAVAIHPGQTEVTVGGSEDNKLHIYKLEGDTLHEENQIGIKGAIIGLAYSSDGVYIASSDAARRVSVFHTADQSPVGRERIYHTARVNCLAFSPDNKHIASGGLDTNIIVWDLEDEKKRITIKGAHAMNQITGIGWLDDNTVVSTGQDCNIIQWSITY